MYILEQVEVERKMTTTSIDEKLQDLEGVENDIGKCLSSASSCLTELSKDKPSSKQVLFNLHFIDAS